MIGVHALTAKVRSDHLDWRKSYDELAMEPFDAPKPIIVACRALMERLGLVFGCFDFIVTPDGRYVFLEVNQMGQFLFVERYTRLPLLDCFTEMLVAGRPDFAWSAARARHAYDDIEPIAYAGVERDLRTHVERLAREASE
jgi:hypothetical protein